MSLADGEMLWSASAGQNYKKSTDIFVADGLVWSRDLKGHDPRTGKVVRTLMQEMTGPMSHDRCYPLYSLNRENGRARWSFIADGRIDSPPTYFKGMILVGSRGGSVYCLRASDGQLAWTFNGMPQRRLICEAGRLESAWPVHGSIMILDDTAYFAAGRSTFLDGGIAWLLDASNGHQLQELRFDAAPV